MTRLAAVLAAALRDADPGSWGGTRQQYAEYPLTAERVVAAIPEPVREAIEAALDVCQWNGCGMPEADLWHSHPDDAHEHDPRRTCHPFVPLVAP